MTQTRGWRLVLAPRDAPPSVRRFAKRARQRRLRALRPWLVALGVLALLGGVAAIVYLTPALGVERIEISGAAVLDPAAVRRAAAVPDGTPLPRIDLPAVERRIAALKPVRTVQVSVRYPHTLVVSLRERTAVAVVPKVGGFTLLDADGVAYLPVDTAPAGLPAIRVAQPEPGDATTMSALAVLAALPQAIREQIVALVAESPTRLRLELTGDRLVIWGDATQNAAKVRVLLNAKVDPGRTLDVSAPGVLVEMSREPVPFVGGESELLAGWLDFHRGTVHVKCAGVAESDAWRAPLPASPLTSVAGLVQHLTAVESYWFERVVAGLDVPRHWTDEDPDLEWRPRPGAGLAVALGAYAAQCERSRRLVAGLEPGALCAGRRHGHAVSVRWVLLHMIEETARHNGHLDAVRELADGVVGD